MADKPTYNTLPSGARIPITELNENFENLSLSIENCLGRGGTSESPNSMAGDLDMDTHKIQNVGAPTADHDAVRLVDLTDSDATGSATAQLRADLGSTEDGFGADLVGNAVKPEDLVGTVLKTELTTSGLSSLSIEAGEVFQTKGYYTAGDGGHGVYLVKTLADYGGVPDGYGDHALANGNVAVLLSSDVVSPKQFGAVGNGVDDDTDAINAVASANSDIYGLGLTYKVDSVPSGLDKFKNTAFLVGSVTHTTRDYFKNVQTTKVTNAGLYTAWAQDKSYKIGDQLVVWANEAEAHTDGTKRPIRYVSDDNGATWQVGEYLVYDADVRGYTTWSAGYSGTTEYVIVRIGDGNADVPPYTYSVYSRTITPNSSTDYNNGGWTITPVTFPTPSHGSGQPAMIHSFTTGHSDSIVVGYHYGTGAGLYRSTDGGATWTEHTIQASGEYEEITVEYNSSDGNYYGFSRGGTTNPKFWYSTDGLSTFVIHEAPAGTFGDNVMADSPIPMTLVEDTIHAFGSYRNGTLEGNTDDKPTSAFYITGTASTGNFWDNATIYKLGFLAHVEEGGSSAVGVGSVLATDNKIHLFFGQGERTGDASTLNRIANIYQAVIPLSDSGGMHDYRDRLPLPSAASGPLRKLPNSGGYGLYVGDNEPLLRLTGRPNFRFAPSTLVISSGVATITEAGGHYRIDTEASASTDDLDTLTDDSAVDGDMIVVSQNSSSRDITLKDGTGNLRLNGDFTLSFAHDRILLEHEGGYWYEVSRGDNA